MSSVHERADWQNQDRDLRDRLNRLLHPEKYDNGPALQWSGADMLPVIASMVDDLPAVEMISTETAMVLYSALERIDDALSGQRDPGEGWEHRVADDAIRLIDQVQQSGR